MLSVSSNRNSTRPVADTQRPESGGKALINAHEHGACRMGDDPKRSPLKGFCQMHEVKNLFLVDGAAFPNASEKNPTLTILALAWRAGDYLAEEMRRGNL